MQQTRKPLFASEQKPIKILKSFCLVGLRFGKMDLDREASRGAKAEVAACVKLPVRGSESLRIYLYTDPMLLLPQLGCGNRAEKITRVFFLAIQVGAELIKPPPTVGLPLLVWRGNRQWKAKRPHSAGTFIRVW